MNIIAATSFHLFGVGKHPRASAAYRGAGLLFALAIIGVTCWRAIPLRLHWPPTPTNTVAITLLTFVCTGALFLLLHGYQQSFFMRLRPLQHLPLSKRRVRALYALAALPLAMVAGLVVLSTQLALFGGVWFWTITASFVLSAGVQFLIRISDAPWNAWPQLTSLALVAAAAVVLLGLRHGGWFWPQLGAGVIMLHGLLVAVLCSRPIRNFGASTNRPVEEGRSLTLTTATALRALRTPRFLAVVGLAFGLPLCLSIAARGWHTIPFDAIAITTLLLSGTLTFELRVLSRKLYPTELVYWAVFNRFIAALWVMSGVGMLLAVLLVVALGNWWFPGQMGTSMQDVFATAASLLGVSLAAASIAVPQKQDMWAQLAAAFLYIGLAWFALRLLRGGVGYGSAVAACGAALAYGIERQRWVTSIRRYHGLFSRS